MSSLGKAMVNPMPGCEGGSMHTYCARAFDLVAVRASGEEVVTSRTSDDAHQADHQCD